MKKFLILTILSFFTHIYSEAQYEYVAERNNTDIWFLYNHPWNFKVPENVSEVVITETSYNRTKQYLRRYNSNGNITGSYRFNKKDSLVPEAVLQYNNQSQVIQASFYKNAHLSYSYHFSYDARGKTIKEEKRNSKNKSLSTSEWIYNSSGCLEEFRVIKKGNIKYYWKHQFYDSCNKSKSVLYDKNGKVKKELDYMCDPEGTKPE